jgi:hypothetical protein
MPKPVQAVRIELRLSSLVDMNFQSRTTIDELCVSGGQSLYETNISDTGMQQSMPWSRVLSGADIDFFPSAHAFVQRQQCEAHSDRQAIVEPKCSAIRTGNRVAGDFGGRERPADWRGFSASSKALGDL